MFLIFQIPRHHRFQQRKGEKAEREDRARARRFERREEKITLNRKFKKENSSLSRR